MIEQVIHALHVPLRWTSEADLQRQIGARLELTPQHVAAEVRLDARDRIDFLLEPSGIGVEVKVDGSLSEVTRQLHRYAQHDRIRALVLATTKAKHIPVPRELSGKPVCVVHMTGGAW
ncbi:MAG: hypothetical protein ACOC9T_03670 [Myxococcota bacterium]